MHVYPNYYKKFYSSNIKKKKLFHKYKNRLEIYVQIRNISGYEGKSRKDLIKALSETKPETAKPETPKLKTPKLKIPKPKPRPEIRVNKKKLKKT